MKIAVIGAGYVGLSTALGLASLGHSVVCVDIDPAKIQSLQNGIIPIGEQYMQDKLSELINKEHITFSTQYLNSNAADYIFLTLPTPLGENASHDLSYLKNCLTALAKVDTFSNSIIVIKSTILPGTTEKLIAFAKGQGIEAKFAYNPEFLREGTALEDFLNPDRIVIGAGNDVVKQKMTKLFVPEDFNDSPLVFTDFRTAELSKCLSNAFLATKISFINEAANLCDKIGANITDVEQIMGLDPRIGSGSLCHGIGYGGSCLPKDTKSVISLGRQSNVKLSVIESADHSNDKRSAGIVVKIKEYFPAVADTTLTIWGVAFKGNSDDVRESVALKIAENLAVEGYNLKIYDPKITVKQCPKLESMKNVRFVKAKQDSLEDSNALIVLNRSAEFSNIRGEEMSGIYVFDFAH
jgi:UDPglucose 6-dehydrogenase